MKILDGLSPRRVVKELTVVPMADLRAVADALRYAIFHYDLLPPQDAPGVAEFVKRCEHERLRVFILGPALLYDPVIDAIHQAEAHAQTSRYAVVGGIPFVLRGETHGSGSRWIPLSIRWGEYEANRYRDSIDWKGLVALQPIPEELSHTELYAKGPLRESLCDLIAITRCIGRGYGNIDYLHYQHAWCLARSEVYVRTTGKDVLLARNEAVWDWNTLISRLSMSVKYHSAPEVRDPIMFGLPKNSDIDDNVDAILGPCWGESLDEEAEAVLRRLANKHSSSNG